MRFRELSPDVKPQALEAIRCMRDQEDDISETLREIAESRGLYVKHIWWSCSGCQGDGVAFDGEWDLDKFLTVQEDLRKQVEEISSLGFTVSACKIQHSGHYTHEYTYTVELELEEKDDSETWWGRLSEACKAPLREAAETQLLALHDAMQERMRDISRECFTAAGNEIDYYNSDEYLTAEAEANEYDFDDDGTLL